MSSAIEIFCCYAREDQLMLAELKKHLMPLQRQGLIKLWSDTDLNAGDAWEKVLHQHLESADIILLLISPDFMASDYCYSIEMDRALQRHNIGNAHVIPILLRSTYWKGTPFAELQMLPKDALPVTNWPHQDDAYSTITEKIVEAVTKLRTQKLSLEQKIQQVLIEAKHLSDKQLYSEALTCYEQVLELDRYNGQASFGKAKALYKLKQYETSVEFFNKAEQIAPDLANAGFYMDKADTLFQLHRLEESLKSYDQATQLDNTNANIYVSKALMLTESKRFEEALYAYNQAMALDPDEALFMYLAGFLLFRLRRFEEALVMYESALKLAPNAAKYHARKGEIFFYLRRYQEAIAAYEQALNLNPQPLYYEQIGQLFLQLEHYEEALAAFEQAIATAKQDRPDLHAYKGQALLYLARYHEAVTSYQTAIQLSTPGSNLEFYNELGNLYTCLAEIAYGCVQANSTTPLSITKKDPFLVPIPTFDPTKLVLLHTLTGHTNCINCLAFSPDNKLLASGSADKSIKLWKLPLGREPITFQGHRDEISQITFNIRENTLISQDTKTIKSWGINSNCERPVFQNHINGSFIYNTAITANNTLFVCGYANDCLKLWELPSGNELFTFPGHEDSISSVAFSPNNNVIAICYEQTIRLWEILSRHKLFTIQCHADLIDTIVFNPKGNMLASGSRDNTIKLWDVSSGRELHTLYGHTNGVIDIAFSPDGNLLASGSWDNTIKLWDVSSGRELHTLHGHTNGVYSVAFSPDGNMLASGNGNNTIKLWGMPS